MPKGYELVKAQDGFGFEGIGNALNDVFGNIDARQVQQQGGSNTDVGQALIDAIFGAGGVGGLGDLFGQSSQSTSQGSSQSSQSQVVLPPAIELLQEMRTRRESEANQANIIADILSGNPPRGQRTYLGFEPGGVADVLLGIITGQGPEAAMGILPMDQRMIRRTDVPVPMGQPGVSEEFGVAQFLANLILNAMRNVGIGQSSSQQSSQSGSVPVAAPAGVAPAAGAAAPLNDPLNFGALNP